MLRKEEIMPTDDDPEQQSGEEPADEPICSKDEAEDDQPGAIR